MAASDIDRDGSELIDSELIDSELIVTSNNRVGRRIPDLEVAGVSEADIFAHAPVMRCDRVYWSTDEPIDLHELMVEIPGSSWTRQWSDGIYRIWVPAGEGAGAREIVREWCLSRGVEPFNLRQETNIAFRDLDLVPEHLLSGLFAACVSWLEPHTTSIQRRLVAELPGIDEDDVPGMMYLFVHDHADRFDSQRLGRNGALNFTAFVLAKMRTWPQDAARSAFGRVSVNDKVALQRVHDELSAELGRRPTEFERAEALGMSVTDLRQREQSVAGLLNMRYADPILSGSDTEALDIADDADTAAAALDSSMRTALTAAIMSAVYDPHDSSRRAVDPLGLAVLYLMFWEGLGRTEIAHHLGILPKTVTSAMKRTMRDIDAEVLA